MKSADGKMYSTDFADQEQLFRLVQSIPSPKVEPIKIWIAQVASERIDEMIDPEISQNVDSSTIAHSINIAHRGGKVAKVAREALEEQLGRNVISQENAYTLNSSGTIRQIDDQSQTD